MKSSSFPPNLRVLLYGTVANLVIFLQEIATNEILTEGDLGKEKPLLAVAMNASAMGSSTEAAATSAATPQTSSSPTSVPPLDSCPKSTCNCDSAATPPPPPPPAEPKKVLYSEMVLFKLCMFRVICFLSNPVPPDSRRVPD